MKKNIFICLFTAVHGLVFAQQAILNRDLIDKNRPVSAHGKMVEYNNISGSAYLNPNFTESTISGYKSIQARYNAFEDQIEYEDVEKKLMILPKEDRYKKIEIAFPKQTIKLLSLENEPTGYYFELLEGKYSIYKKIKINFIDEKPVSSPYGTENQASFSAPVLTYFIISDNKVISKFQNQKDFQNFAKTDKALQTFVKENKIKFNRDNDVIKLVTYLNSK